MEVQHRVHGKGPEEVLEEVEVEAPHPRLRERDGVGEVGTAGDVDVDGGQRLVHRHERRAEPDDADLVAERLVEGLPQADPDVLDGVVGVDLDVAARLDPEVEEAVLGHRLQHVAQERDGRVHADLPRAVHGELEQDLRLAGLPLDPRDPTLHADGGPRAVPGARRRHRRGGAGRRQCPGRPRAAAPPSSPSSCHVYSAPSTRASTRRRAASA